MNSGILSQEEIDALLKMNNDEVNDSNNTGNINTISDFEKDAVGEVGNISMGTSATTLSTLLGKRVSITTPQVKMIDSKQIQSEFPRPYVVIQVGYTQGLIGTNVLVISESDACIIADLMMGGDGNCQEKHLDEIKLSAISEAMNQMIGSSTTSLSSMFNRRIDIAPPHLNVVDLGKEQLDLATDFQNLVQVKFRMIIEGLVDSEIMQLIPLEAVKQMVGLLMGTADDFANTEITSEPLFDEKPEENSLNNTPIQDNYGITKTIDESAYQPNLAMPDTQNIDIQNTEKQRKETKIVQPVQFVDLNKNGDQATPQNISLIMDVPLDVKVELGKTRKTIKEVLELNQGAIIELDKMAGEPVDLLVNGKLIAKGEVVVIDENYGIRVTTILSANARMNKLQ